MDDKKVKIEKTDDDWEMILTPNQFKSLRKKETEAPFSGDLLKMDKGGVYRCAACGNELFLSNAKFDSGTGWPSFDRALNEENLIFRKDESGGMTRTEVLCARCGSHLGHVFDDGPTETKKRYCINSVCMIFKEGKKE